MADLFTSEALLSLFTLTILEIVLGIDNIIFISILTDKLPRHQQARGRTIGLALALGVRVLLLFTISWLASLTQPLFTLGALHPSGRDLILFVGGVFLLFKTIKEIAEKLRHHDQGEEGPKNNGRAVTFSGIIVQIILIDIVFSFDSILTAVGLSNQFPIMVGAVVISMIIMMIASGKVSAFINERPTIKMLALAFLVLIGTMLVLESIHVEVSKAYAYVAMGFSLTVEFLNLKMQRKL
jgi:predicted tellurium resistance membrane protein TerC